MTREQGNFEITYIETSAKTGKNVEIAFEALARNVFSWLEVQKEKRRQMKKKK